MPAECTPATVNFERSLLRVFVHGSDDRIAVVSSNALFRLVTEFVVSLTATICSKRQKVFDAREAGQLPPNRNFPVKYCSLRIIVYGFLRQKQEVADILANGGLFLQHPDPSEFDRSVKYVNPQYFLPPGTKMPEIETLSIYTCCTGRGAKQGSLHDTLGESQRSQILSIFNTAYESKELMTILKPSTRLVTKLKRYELPR